MKVRDLLPMDIDIDVYDDVCEELGIAFCGPLELTKDGTEKFADVLDYDLTINSHSYGNMPACIVRIDDADDSVWKERLSKAKEFFESAAGYCADEDYDKWFVTA